MGQPPEPNVDVSGLPGATLGLAEIAMSWWSLPNDQGTVGFTAARIRINPLFDAAFYRAQANLDGEDLDPAEHYVLVGEVLGLLPSEDFDPDYYARRNPDVVRTGMNLLLHYAEFGRAEGRYGRTPAAFHTNPERFDSARENVIVGVHETSRTGAPILGWNIVQHLATRYNVFTVRLGDGALTPEFEALSAETHGPFPLTQRHVVDIECGLKPLFANRVFRYAIINSSESRPLLETCVRHFVPTLFLMHEFGSYVHPANSLRNAFDWATEIVFSAPIVARASEMVHPALRQRTIRILPQGMSVVPAGNVPSKPPPTAKLDALARRREAGSFIVVGAGSVEYRKGVDLFLTAAVAARRSNLGRPMHFVWVGRGYQPDEDMGYSVYLREQLQRSAMEADVTFLDEVSDLEPVYALADVFLLSSRLDPLPNVCIDVALRRVPIVCFRDASGMADLMLGDPDTASGVVSHLDAEAAGQLLAHLASDEPSRRRLADATLRLARTTFDMDRYVAQLDALGTALVTCAVQLRADAETLLLDDSFDQDFYLGAEPVLQSREATIALYLVRRDWEKPGGRHPAPGFDPRVWAASHRERIAPGADPLAEFIRAGHPAGPWQIPVLRPAADPAAVPAPGPRAILHAHLPDPALAADLLAHLDRNTLACDLLVSTDTDAKATQLCRALASYRTGAVSVLTLDGDLPSLIAHLGPDLAAYDVVGHIHAWPENAHATRREFQWQTLIGGRYGMRDRILEAFAHRPELGLAFPADRYLPDWDDATRTRTAALAARLGYTGPQPEFTYRCGGMLWMRSAVLQSLDGINQADLAEDAAVLDHLLPLATKMVGLSCAVTHVPGVLW